MYTIDYEEMVSTPGCAEYYSDDKEVRGYCPIGKAIKQIIKRNFFNEEIMEPGNEVAKLYVELQETIGEKELNKVMALNDRDNEVFEVRHLAAINLLVNAGQSSGVFNVINAPIGV